MYETCPIIDVQSDKYCKVRSRLHRMGEFYGSIFPKESEEGDIEKWPQNVLVLVILMTNITTNISD